MTPAPPVVAHPAPNLEVCPFCSRHGLVLLMKEGARFYLRCQTCGATGPHQQTRAAAEYAWNQTGDLLAAERSQIATEARRRAAAIKAAGAIAKDGWEQGEGAAGALETFASWVAGRSVRRPAQRVKKGKKG